MDSYAGYCYRYYTYGTKQGDWHMIDLNTFYMFLAAGDHNSPNISFSSMLQRTREAVGDGGNYNFNKILTAFTWLDGHRA